MGGALHKLTLKINYTPIGNLNLRTPQNKMSPRPQQSTLEETPPCCASCTKVIHNTGEAYLTPTPGLYACSKRCLKTHIKQVRDVKKRACRQCSNDLPHPTKTFHYNYEDFCSCDCISNYKKENDVLKPPQSKRLTRFDCGGQAAF